MSLLLPISRRAAILRNRETPYVYAPETQAVIVRALSEGFILPEIPKLQALDRMLISLKDQGVFNKTDVILNAAYNQLGLSNFARINLKSPTATLATVHGGMLYTLKGWEGNGVDGYVDTQFSRAMGVNLTLNNAGMGSVVYKTEDLGSIIGLKETLYTLRLLNQATVAHDLYTGGQQRFVDLSGTGLKTAYKDDSLNLRFYSKDVETPNASRTVDDYPNSTNVLFQRNNSNFSTLGQSFIFLSKSLTETENATIRTIYNQYLTDISLTPYA